MEREYSERIQEILQEITQITEDFKGKEAEFKEEFRKSKNSLLLVEDFLSEVGSLTDSFNEGLKEIKGVVEKKGEKKEKERAELEEEVEKIEKERAELEEEVEEMEESMLSLRFEIVSVLDDLAYIPDVLLRENIEIISRILRDKDEEIKNHFIFSQLKKSV